MGKKQRLLSYVAWGGVALCLWLGLLLSPSLANAQDPVKVSISAPAEAAQDSGFVVRVVIDNVPDFDAGNYDVGYDPAVLEVVGDEGGASGVTAGRIGTTSVPVDMWGFIPAETPGAIRVVQNIPGVAGISGSGYLVKSIFALSAPVVSPL